MAKIKHDFLRIRQLRCVQCLRVFPAQLVSGLYTVVGMPGDTLAQVVQSAMAKVTTPTGARKMQRRLFKVALFAAALAACATAGVTAIRKFRKPSTWIVTARLC